MRTSRKPQAVILRSNPQLSILKQNCTDPRMHLALDLLAACDLKDELRTDHICEALNLSASRLRHLFHEQLGMSPAQVWKSLRMQEARNLLISTYKRTKENLTEVGYSSARASKLGSARARKGERARGMPDSTRARRSAWAASRCGPGLPTSASH